MSSKKLIISYGASWVEKSANLAELEIILASSDNESQESLQHARTLAAGTTQFLRDLKNPTDLGEVLRKHIKDLLGEASEKKEFIIFSKVNFVFNEQSEKGLSTREPLSEKEKAVLQDVFVEQYSRLVGAESV